MLSFIHFASAVRDVPSKTAPLRRFTFPVPYHQKKPRRIRGLLFEETYEEVFRNFLRCIVIVSARNGKSRAQK